MYSLNTEAAIDAGAKAARFIEPNLYQTPHNPEAYYTSVAQEILKAALPHIRERVAQEIAEGTNTFIGPPDEQDFFFYKEGHAHARNMAIKIAQGKS